MTITSDQLVLRLATTDDLSMLTTLNRQLIDDQGHDNPSGPAELELRMRTWLSGEYTVGIFESDGVAVGYAVWREHDRGVYLRQFFVVREQRRCGIGRQAFNRLQRDWGSDDVTLDVLEHNTTAIAFWRSLGFQDYSLTLRRRPSGTTTRRSS